MPNLKPKFLFNRRGRPVFYEDDKVKAELLTSGNFKEPQENEKLQYNPLYDEGPNVKTIPPIKPTASRIITTKLGKKLDIEQV